MENIYKDNVKTEKVRQILNDMKKSQNSVALEIGNAVQAMIKSGIYIAVAGLLVWAGLESLSSSFSTPRVGYLQTVGMLAGLRAFSLVILEPLISKKV